MDVFGDGHEGEKWSLDTPQSWNVFGDGYEGEKWSLGTPQYGQINQCDDLGAEVGAVVEGKAAVLRAGYCRSYGSES